MKRSGLLAVLLGMLVTTGCDASPILGLWKGNTVSSQNQDVLSLGGDGTGYLLLYFTESNDMTNAVHHAEFDATWVAKASSTYVIQGACRERDDDTTSDCSDIDITLTCNVPAPDPSTNRVSSFSCTAGEGVWMGQSFSWSEA